MPELSVINLLTVKPFILTFIVVCLWKGTSQRSFIDAVVMLSQELICRSSEQGRKAMLIQPFSFSFATIRLDLSDIQLKPVWEREPYTAVEKHK